MLSGAKATEEFNSSCQPFQIQPGSLIQKLYNSFFVSFCQFSSLINKTIQESHLSIYLVGIQNHFRLQSVWFAQPKSAGLAKAALASQNCLTISCKSVQFCMQTLVRKIFCICNNLEVFCEPAALCWWNRMKFANYFGWEIILLWSRKGQKLFKSNSSVICCESFPWLDFSKKHKGGAYRGTHLWSNSCSTVIYKTPTDFSRGRERPAPNSFEETP